MATRRYKVIDAEYGGISPMTPAQEAAFGGATFVIAVQLRDSEELPLVNIFAPSPRTIAPTTDLRPVASIPAGGNGVAYQFIPDDNEIIQIIEADGLRRICVIKNGQLVCTRLALTKTYDEP